ILSGLASLHRRITAVIKHCMTAGSSSSSRILAWLQLMRLPNVFTAMADVLMGFWLTHATLSPIGVLLLLLAASSLLYVAGMVLNDVYDLEQDCRERPKRPLPSGRIPMRFAKGIGITMLAAGIVFGWCVVFLLYQGEPETMLLRLRPGIVVV